MKNLNKKQGFTLTELIIVIVIIGILAAVLIPNLVRYVDRAKESNAREEARIALQDLNLAVLEAQIDTELVDPTTTDGDQKNALMASLFAIDAKYGGNFKVIVLVECDDLTTNTSGQETAKKLTAEKSATSQTYSAPETLYVKFDKDYKVVLAYFISENGVKLTYDGTAWSKVNP